MQRLANNGFLLVDDEAVALCVCLSLDQCIDRPMMHWPSHRSNSGRVNSSFSSSWKPWISRNRQSTDRLTIPIRSFRPRPHTTDRLALSRSPLQQRGGHCSREPSQASTSYWTGSHAPHRDRPFARGPSGAGRGLPAVLGRPDDGRYVTVQVCMYTWNVQFGTCVSAPQSPARARCAPAPPHPTYPPNNSKILQQSNQPTHTAPRQQLRARGAVTLQATAPPAEAELFAKNIMSTYGRYPITMVKYAS